MTLGQENSEREDSLGDIAKPFLKRKIQGFLSSGKIQDSSLNKKKATAMCAGINMGRWYVLPNRESQHCKGLMGSSPFNDINFKK